ncbi:MAG: outer membrane protein [Reyranellaceae bacterium]
MMRYLIRALALALAWAIAPSASAQSSVPSFDSSDFQKCFEVLAPYTTSLPLLADNPAATVAAMRRLQSDAETRRREIERVMANIQGDYALAVDFSRLSQYERDYLFAAGLRYLDLRRQLEGVMAELKCWSIMIYVLRQRLPPFEPGPFVKLQIPPPPPPRPPLPEEAALARLLELLRQWAEIKEREAQERLAEIDRRKKMVDDELARRGGDIGPGGRWYSVGGVGAFVIPTNRPGLGTTQELNLKNGFAGGLELGIEWRLAPTWGLRGVVEAGYVHTGMAELVNIGGASVPFSGHYSSMYGLVGADLIYRPLPDLAIFAGAGIGIARNLVNLRNRFGVTVIDDSHTAFAYRLRAGLETRVGGTGLWVGPSVAYFGTTGGTATNSTGNAFFQIGGRQGVQLMMTGRFSFAR